MAIDPANKLHWRKSRLRLDAEAIRDSLLEVSGLLNHEMLGGIDPIKKADDGQFVQDESKRPANRRSIYLAQSRTRPVGFLNAFDMPTMTQNSEAKRFHSTRPSQSLVLMNNPLMRKCSRALASQALELQYDSLDQRLNAIFQRIYTRGPSSDELDAANNLMRQSEDPCIAMELLVQAMMGANDFLYSY